MVRFYNQRGMAEQWIRGIKQAAASLASFLPSLPRLGNSVSAQQPGQRDPETPRAAASHGVDNRSDARLDTTLSAVRQLDGPLKNMENACKLSMVERWLRGVQNG